MTEIRALTGARGLAAWLVVLFHIRGSIAGVPAGLMRVLDKGYLAVDFFFLLSGFVIWLAWHERLHDRRAIPAFLLKRVLRVWPLHAVMLAAFVTIVAAQGVLGHPVGAEFPYRDLPLHLLLTQDWGLVPPTTWNVPAWSISAELVAYALFPLLVLTIDWRRCPTPVVLLGVAVPLAVLAWAMRGETMLGQDIAGFGVLRCVTEFAAGTAVGALWLRWRGDVSARWPMLAAAVGLVALAIGAPEVIDAPATLAALLLGLALGAETPGHVLEGRAVHWLGTISYATYLSHYVLWHAFKLVAVRNVADVPPLSIAIFLALVLAASAFLYTYVEVPAQRWRGLRGWSPRSSPARGGGAPQA